MNDFNTIAEQVIFENVIEQFLNTAKIGDSWFYQSHEIYNMTFSEAVQYLTTQDDE